MIGYAKANSHTQKYNCHKLVEYGVGSPLDITNFGQLAKFVGMDRADSAEDSSTPSLAQALVTLHKARIPVTVTEKLDFYRELVREEQESSMDLDYWIEYLDKFDIGHRVPLYDFQGISQYYNLDIILGLLASFFTLKWLLSCVFCRDPKPASNADDSKKVKTD